MENPHLKWITRPEDDNLFPILTSSGSSIAVPSGNLIIALKNRPFIDVLATKMVIFHSYVSLPEGMTVHLVGGGFLKWAYLQIIL